MHESQRSAWSQQIDVMLTGVFLCSQAFGRLMIGRGSGSIVSIASIGGMGGWPMPEGKRILS